MSTTTTIVSVRDALLFEPHFRPKRESDAIRRCMTAQQKRRWTIYFEKFGCLACGHTRKRIHAGNGYCTRCFTNIAARLRSIVRELSNERETIPAELHEISAAVREAERLLGPLPRTNSRRVFQEPLKAGASTLRERVGSKSTARAVPPLQQSPAVQPQQIRIHRARRKKSNSHGQISRIHPRRAAKCAERSNFRRIFTPGCHAGRSELRAERTISAELALT